MRGLKKNSNLFFLRSLCCAQSICGKSNEGMAGKEELPARASRTRRTRRASPHRGLRGIAGLRPCALALTRLPQSAPLKPNRLPPPASLPPCVDPIAAWRTDSSGMRPQQFLSALSALFHLFKCITHSASRQDSSGQRPQPFLCALCALCALFKCIPLDLFKQRIRRIPGEIVP